MAREKKYVKTVAVRLTDAEWEKVQAAMAAGKHKNPTEVFRAWIAPALAQVNA